MTWPVVYTLPLMPLLESRLQSVEGTDTAEGQRMKLDASFANRLVDYLFEDLRQYTSPDNP